VAVAGVNQRDHDRLVPGEQHAQHRPWPGRVDRTEAGDAEPAVEISESGARNRGTKRPRDRTRRGLCSWICRCTSARQPDRSPDRGARGACRGSTSRLRRSWSAPRRSCAR
jgi:hypothetical protein